MENPPFSEAGSGGTQSTGKKENIWKNSFVMKEMRKELKGTVLNELANLFIWSGFHFYLRKPTDSYILYSPTKYWRNQNLVNKNCAGGFMCNRKEFHASIPSATGCIWWKNINDNETNTLSFPAYEICGEKTIRIVDVVIRKANHFLSEAYDNRKFDDNENGILCERNGKEFVDNGRQKRIQPIYNENIIAYLKTDSLSIDRKPVSLTISGYFKGDGFFVRKDNFIEKLPLFVASVFPCDKWYKVDVYSKSYDGQGSFLEDKDFLKQCLIYTSLSAKNKCRSLMGSNGIFYHNELCFDMKDTLAWEALQKLLNQGLHLSEMENNLLKYWDDVIYEAKQTEEYKSNMAISSLFRHGLWQIMEEINVKIDSGRVDKKNKPIYVQKYTRLNTEIKKLEISLKEYYKKELVPLLFKYELIK